MNELHTRCLDLFPEWLRSLAADAGELAVVLAAATTPESTRRYVAGGLNYLFKSLDLIPDGIEDLGFLDDAFVIRVAAALALHEAASVASVASVASGASGAREPVLVRLAADTKVISDLLGKDYTRLEAYVKTLTRGTARGRTVDELLHDEAARSAFLHEVSGWAASYETPSFSRDEKNLVKLQSFLSAKLPV
jgi:uncharacterized membrane protein YkvA (DUF1232 family)